MAVRYGSIVYCSIATPNLPGCVCDVVRFPKDALGLARLARRCNLDLGKSARQAARVCVVGGGGGEVVRLRELSDVERTRPTTSTPQQQQHCNCLQSRQKALLIAPRNY